MRPFRRVLVGHIDQVAFLGLLRACGRIVVYPAFTLWSTLRNDA